METVYINREKDDNKLSIESVYFYCSYLTADKLYFNSLLPDYINTYHDRSAWTDKFIIESCKKVVKNFDEVIPPAMYDELITAIKRLSAMQHKDHAAMLIKKRISTIAGGMKRTLVKIFEDSFCEHNITNWVDLFDQQTDCSGKFTEYTNEADVTKQDPMMNEIGDLLIDIEGRKKFLMLHPDIRLIKKGEMIDQEKNNDQADFYSFPLFQFPFIPSITKEALTIVRAEMIRCGQSLIRILQNFKSVIQQGTFSKDIQSYISEEYSRIKTEAKAIQKAIDEQMYFRQAINAGEDVSYYTLNAGICSIATLTEFYRDTNVLIPFVYEALLKKLTIESGIEKNYVFLYINTDEPSACPV